MADELRHYGVQGMKWGARRGIAKAANRRIETYKRVAEGKGTFRDKVKVADRAGLGRLLINRSLTKVANTKLKELQDREARIESGKGTVRDKLKNVMNASTLDIVKG